MNPNKLAQVLHFDLYGKREAKYDFLNENSLKSIEWNNLQPEAPNFFLVKKDFAGSETYELGFKTDELFRTLNPGIESGRDDFFIDFDRKDLINKVEDVFENKNDSVLKSRYGISDTTSFRFQTNLNISQFDLKNIQKISYRPFDLRYNYYDIKLQRRPSNETFKHIVKGSLGIVVKRGFDEINSAPVFVVNAIADRRGWTRAGMQGAESIAPLYLYPEENSQDLFAKTERTPNLNQAIIDKLAEGLGLKFTLEKEKTRGTFAPIDVLDYIYTVLHSPVYREKYKEFLKIDFPRVPYPKDLSTFWKLVKLGGEIRQIHLLESPVVEEYITQYPEDGDNVVVKISFAPSQLERVGATDASVRLGRVYINENQYFDNVPETAWNFYIGGYQPAQKWLKDRKERELSFEDILHYQKIIVALTETARIMQEIDLVGVE